MAVVLAGGTLGFAWPVVGRVKAAAGHRTPASPSVPGSGWETVTVNRPLEVVNSSGVDRGPVADLGDRVEIGAAAAAGDRGSELRARWTPTPSGDAGSTGRSSELRLALRRTRQLIETGEILAVEPQPAGHRPRTATGSVFDAVVRRSAAGGPR